MRKKLPGLAPKRSAGRRTYERRYTMSRKRKKVQPLQEVVVDGVTFVKVKTKSDRKQVQQHRNSTKGWSGYYVEQAGNVKSGMTKY